MIRNCSKCGWLIYVEPAGKNTKTLCVACEKKDKLDKQVKQTAGFASGPVNSGEKK